MDFYDYSDENSKGKIETAIYNKCQLELDNFKKENKKIIDFLILKIQALEETIKNIKDNSKIEETHHNTETAFKYIEHKTSEGKINYFRVTKIQTGSLTSGEGWTDYIRDIYVEKCNFSEGQFICKDENGLFQIWDNIECKYVDYLSYDKESDDDTIEYNFWIKHDSNTIDRYKAPNIKSFLEILASEKNYDIMYLN